MSLFPEWQDEHKDDFNLPKRINEMHILYGKTAGKTCKGCLHLEHHKQGARWLKCGLSKKTASIATDWKAGWPACGKYEESEE